MYQVTHERAKGPFGILKKRTAICQIDESQEKAKFGLSNGIEMLWNNGLLVLHNTGNQLFRVDFRAQPQMRLRGFADILSPDHPVISTSRSHITITPLEEYNAGRIIIQKQEPKPLVLNDREIRALMIGINAMQPGILSAFEDGRKQGLDEGYRKGSQPHPTNL